MPTTDWSDPCQRATALWAAYYARISGQAETEIHTRTLDSEERVKFAETKPADLKREAEAAQALCDAQTPGSRPRRYAFTAG